MLVLNISKQIEKLNEREQTCDEILLIYDRFVFMIN